MSCSAQLSMKNVLLPQEQIICISSVLRRMNMLILVLLFAICLLFKHYNQKKFLPVLTVLENLVAVETVT